jgi:hypothetical protein
MKYVKLKIYTYNIVKYIILDVIYLIHFRIQTVYNLNYTPKNLWVQNRREIISAVR